MSEQIIIAGATLLAIGVIGFILLRGWQGWLDLKNRELEMHHPKQERGSPEGAARIELADLKERVRQLEAIANGVEL